MPVSSFVTGFALGFSLILAIGAQNFALTVARETRSLVFQSTIE